MEMVLPMQYLSSSKAEDEPLCLALLAGALISAFLQFPPDCRMEQLFGQFSGVPGNIILSEKSRINKPAQKWIPLSLLDRWNLYSGPAGNTTPDGLLVKFPGIVLGPLDNNKLFPCRYTSPNGLFYLKHEDHTALYKYKTKNYEIIPEEKRREDGSFGHNPAFGIEQHSGLNYQHYNITGCVAALILEGKNGEDDWVKERDVAFVSIYKSEEDVLFVSFEFSLTLNRIKANVQELDGSVPGMEAVNVFAAQTWCVG
jgi:hypothetical protein